MDNIAFSLVLPSRERVPLLEQFLQSVIDTTDDITRIEVLLAIDEDDPATLHAMLRHREFNNYFLISGRQHNFSVGYYNRLAHISRGDYVWALNDDCVLTQKGWDTLALAHFDEAKRQFPDGIFYVRTHDDLGTGYSCFPMLSRPAYQVCGWMFHPEFPSWGADINAHQIWDQVGRIVDAPELAVKHFTHHNGSRARDHVNERVGQIARYNWGCAPGEANRIRNIIRDLSAG